MACWWGGFCTDAGGADGREACAMPSNWAALACASPTSRCPTSRRLGKYNPK
jgi:hypothetical protein